MDDSTLQSAVEILKNCKQEHLLDFYNELDSNQQIGLVNQIVSTDFKKMQNLYENSQKDDSISFSRITPMPYIIKSSLSASNSSLYSRIGEKVIKNGELAVITLAGGKGSRL